MRANEFMNLYKKPNHSTVHDLDVVAWSLYSTTANNVDVELVSEPMSKFALHAKKQWAVFKKRIGEKRKVESNIDL